MNNAELITFVSERFAERESERDSPQSGNYVCVCVHVCAFAKSPN